MCACVCVLFRHANFHLIKVELGSFKFASIFDACARFVSLFSESVFIKFVGRFFLFLFSGSVCLCVRTIVYNLGCILATASEYLISNVVPLHLLCSRRQRQRSFVRVQFRVVKSKSDNVDDDQRTSNWLLMQYSMHLRKNLSIRRDWKKYFLLVVVEIVAQR